MKALFQGIVTLFNRYSSALGDVWYPTVIHGVQVSLDKAAMVAQYGESTQDVVSVHIPYKVDGEARMVAGKTWLPPKEWDAQTNDKLVNTLTFTAGADFDFIMLDDWGGDEDPVNDEDYLDGFYNHMNKKHDYVFSITSVSGPFGVIPHFEITGR